MPLRKSASRGSEIKNIKIIKFLGEYKKHTCLWNPKNHYYKNKSARDDAYEQMIAALNIADLEVNDIKLKIKSIRTTYKKELTIVNRALKDGHVYVPKLFWFDTAHSFLKYVLPSNNFDDGSFKTDETDSNQKADELTPLDYISITTESDKETKMFNAQNVQADTTKKDSRRYETFETYEDTEIIQQPVNMEIPDDNASKPGVSQSRNEIAIEDDFELFCRSVAAQLRNISDAYSQSVAKFKIQQILFEAETGQYRKSVVLTLPATQGVADQ